MKSGAKGAVAGGSIVGAVALVVAFTGGLDRLGMATDEEIKDLPSAEEIQAMLEPIRAELEKLRTGDEKTDDRLDGIATNLAAFQGAWIQWKESQE